jgi:metal-responsive CopG/Arc/MetJ family transcriptional regulator
METALNAEITIRLEGEVLTAIDAIAQNTGLSSRSAAIEKILRRWYEVAWLQQESDRETEAYYKSLTPEEIAEDRAWVQFASEQAMQRWDDR